MFKGLLGRRSSPSAAVTTALYQAIDLDPYRAAIEAGHRPRHILLDLADRTGGRVITGHGAKPGRLDRLGGRFIGDAQVWWVARQAVRAANGGHIQTNGEGIGFAVLVLRGLRPRQAKRVGFWVMTPNGGRVRWWLRLTRLLRLRPIMLAESDVKAEQIRRVAGPRARVAMFDSPVDLRFFSPDPDPAVAPARPLVASAGLEKRDYRTLAAAVEGLDVDVRICAVSPDAANTSARLPDQLPDNMAYVDLTIEELRDLYRRASLVVVPTVANEIDAGGSSVVEALACGSPVVATAQGMYLDLARAGVLQVYEVGGPESLRQVITEALDQPDKRAEMGRRARAVILADHDDRHYMDRLIDEIRRGGVEVQEIQPPSVDVKLAS